MLKEQISAERTPEEAGKANNVVQPEHVTRQPGYRALQESRQESCKRMQECWEAQWQEFLKALQAPHSAWGNLQLSEATLGSDTKAFLASFEQVAEACRWPRGEWVARLLPALNEKAEQVFGSLEASDKDNYGKVKAAILRGDAMRREMQRQQFWQFCCQEVEDPRRVYNQLQELCCQWLKPEKHTKEQILDLLILEQFLACLPVDLRSWIQAVGPDSCSQAVALADDCLMRRREAEMRKWLGSVKEEHIDSLEAHEESLGTAHRQIYKEAKQNGSGIQCPDHSSSSLPPGQEMTEAGLTKDTEVTLHLVEQTPTELGQWSVLWQVLHEDGGDVQSPGGLLVLKSETSSHLEKEAEMSIHLPVKSERFTDQNSRRMRIKNLNTKD
ncbi:zinc finger protein with KRAB and SCAN domains 1-like isoform X2 [Hemicordylus capensis]|uniref:zinc finger protein with KRAB and SCAN domains 1-like isoform X2 n=1 Tax=Hemicordylus capensis TaxID=884348 RepID=UPI0023022942|nr:zinc finger protein with KRAB and SCAN domains 1-like isoform X2 [Hemicordylus capensis]